MTCLGCKRDQRPANFAHDRKCAFDENGVFTSENWNCAALEAIREAAAEREVYSDDSHAALLPYTDADGSGAWILVTYYKHRGRTSLVEILEEDGTRRPFTLDDAQRFARSFAGLRAGAVGWICGS